MCIIFFNRQPRETVSGETLPATTHPGQVVPDVVTICVSYFTTGSSGKEHGTNKPPPTGRIWERSKGDSTCPTTSQNPPP